MIVISPAFKPGGHIGVVPETEVTSRQEITNNLLGLSAMVCLLHRFSKPSL